MSQTFFESPQDYTNSIPASPPSAFCTNAGVQKLDFSCFQNRQATDFIDVNTAEGLLEKEKSDEEYRRQKAADICIRRFSTMKEHLTAWPVS
mgnify:CR=1 FL=1